MAGKKECNYCQPTWTLKGLMVSVTRKPIRDVNTWQLTPGVEVSMTLRACLDKLECATGDPPPSPPGPRLPDVKAENIGMGFYPHFEFMRGRPGFVAPRLPIPSKLTWSGWFIRSDILVLLGQDVEPGIVRVPPIGSPITFKGRVDMYQGKVCCKKEAIGGWHGTIPPSKEGCCATKRDVICKCWADGNHGLWGTTIEDCCIQEGVEQMSNHTFQIPITVVDFGFFQDLDAPDLAPGRMVTFLNDPAMKERISEQIQEYLESLGGRGSKLDAACTGTDHGFGQFNPPEPTTSWLGFDWTNKCRCIEDPSGNDKCP